MSTFSLLARTVACMVCLIAVSGCTTTKSSRLAAQTAHDSMDRYVQDRQTSIDNLNATYRATYATLLRQHTDVTRSLLDLERRAEARSVADAMLLDWQRNTTFTALAKSLGETRARQLAGMQARADVLTAARLRYAEAFTELDLDLAKLKKAQKHMADLAQEEDVRERTTQFLVKVAEIYRKSQSEKTPTP